MFNVSISNCENLGKTLYNQAEVNLSLYQACIITESLYHNVMSSCVIYV